MHQIMRLTSCCWHELTNSNLWNPRIRSNTRKKSRKLRGDEQAKNTRKKHTPEEEVDKYRNSSVPPVSQSHCLALVRRKSYSISSSFVENSSQCSWPSSVNTSRSSWMQFCCCFQMRHFVDACEAVLRNCCIHVVVISFSLWLCDVGCFFVTRSHSTKVLAGRFGLFCLVLTSVVLTRSLCKFSSCRLHLLLSLAVDPCFVGLIADFDWGFHVLQILVWGIRWSRSSSRSVGPIS